jgi:hypothetical protein
MFQLLNQLMQSQMPTQSAGIKPQQTLGQLFQDPNQAAHKPLEMPAPPPSMTFQKMAPKFATGTYAGRQQAAEGLGKPNVAPEDEMAYQAQGKRIMNAMAALK